MLLFRVGGDEFALVTGLEDALQAEKLARKVITMNGQIVESEGQIVPVFMRVGGMKIGGGCLKYGELFTNIKASIDETRRSNEDVKII